MHMVRRSVDRDRGASQILEEAAHERMQSFLDFLRDHRKAMLGAEHRVVDVLGP